MNDGIIAYGEKLTLYYGISRKILMALGEMHVPKLRTQYSIGLKSAIKGNCFDAKKIQGEI